jgi:hypothetical protein
MSVLRADERQMSISSETPPTVSSPLLECTSRTLIRGQSTLSTPTTPRRTAPILPMFSLCNSRHRKSLQKIVFFLWQTGTVGAKSPHSSFPHSRLHVFPVFGESKQHDLRRLHLQSEHCNSHCSEQPSKLPRNCTRSRIVWTRMHELRGNFPANVNLANPFL